MSQKIFKTTFANRELTVEFGTLANLSLQSVLVRYGDSVVLTTINYQTNKGVYDFFPLTVVFQEKLYSIGKIPGGFLRREGFPGEHATLCARLIDRMLRPLFPKGFHHEVQIVNNILAHDEVSNIRFLTSFASSVVSLLSGLPFSTPCALVVVGKVDNQLVINPSHSQSEISNFELIVGGTQDTINMVEASCFDTEETQMIEAMEFGHNSIKELVTFQNKIVTAMKVEKLEFKIIKTPETIVAFMEKYKQEVQALASLKDKKTRQQRKQELTEKIVESYLQDNPDTENHSECTKLLENDIEDILRTEMRNNILNSGIRIDGREVDEVRPLSSRIDILPIVHGSALFNRGETQVLSVLTLGGLKEQQIIDDLGTENFKRFLHHYNFPPFSVGETGRMGKPSRREIGHGALGEKALSQILPTEKDFPYTIRIVSEVLASNGSTSQAAICASSLAMMAGGVPIRTQIAGIAMGLIQEDNKSVILTDIQGLEDHLGDMDFKVAGTKDGICALQMDMKVSGINFALLKEALDRAKIARLKVLENMNEVISVPRKTLSKTAPKIIQHQIPVDKIREVIGTQGKIINKIISDSGDVKIDIEDDGRIMIYHTNQAAIDKAWNMIDEIINPTPIVIGDEFIGKVIKIMSFGAFVNLKDKVDGLIHISQFSKFFGKHLETLNEVVKVTDEFAVKVVKIEPNGKFNLEIIAKK